MVFGLLCFFSQLIIMPAFAGIFAGEIHEKKITWKLTHRCNMG